MNRKKIVIGIIMIVVLIVLGSASYALSSMIFQKDKTEEKKDQVTVKTDRKLELCKTEGCMNYSTLYFPKVSTNIDDEKAKEFIQQTNKKINTYYNEVKNDQMTRPECTNVANIYQHGIGIQSGIQAKIHKHVLNIVVAADKYDYCAGQTLGQEIEVYLYDLENKKEISNEEYLKENGYTENQVKNMMETLMRKIYSADEVENIIATAKKENQYVIYYDNSNQLVIQYYIPTVNAWYPLQLNQNES